MSRNVNDVMRTLNSAQRKKVEARAAELIADEMTLQELRRGNLSLVAEFPDCAPLSCPALPK